MKIIININILYGKNIYMCVYVGVSICLYICTHTDMESTDELQEDWIAQSIFKC